MLFITYRHIQFFLYDRDRYSKFDDCHQFAHYMADMGTVECKEHVTCLQCPFSDRYKTQVEDLFLENKLEALDL